VSVSGPLFRVTPQKLPSIANRLLQCVRGISWDMGFFASGRNNRAAAWSA
jgi:DNA-binding IclR family transcriptional regulator